MSLTVIKPNQKKPAGNKQAQDGNGNEFEDDDEEDDELENKPSSVDLIQLIHDDNSEVAELFFQFSQAEEDDEKQEIFDKLALGMKVHAQLVEEIYYPLLTETAKEDDKEDAEKLVFEAEASNYVSSMILDVLKTMEPSDEYFEGKMCALHVLAKEQTKREEKEMFEKLQNAESEVDFDEIGMNAVERKMELQEELSAKGKRSKARAKSAPKASGKKAKSAAKKAPAKASGKSSAKSKATSKAKPSASKSKASSSKSKASSKGSGAKSKAAPKAKSGAKSKTTSRATSKAAKKTTGKSAAKKTTSKRGK